MRKAKPKQRLQRKRPLKRWTIREIEAALRYHDQGMYPAEVAELVDCHEGDVLALVALIAQRLAELRAPPACDPEAPLPTSPPAILADEAWAAPHRGEEPQVQRRPRGERSVELDGVPAIPSSVARAMVDGSESPDIRRGRGWTRPASQLSADVEQAADAGIAAATAEIRARKLARLGNPSGDPTNLD